MILEARRWVQGRGSGEGERTGEDGVPKSACSLLPAEHALKPPVQGSHPGPASQPALIGTSVHPISGTSMLNTTK